MKSLQEIKTGNLYRIYPDEIILDFPKENDIEIFSIPTILLKSGDLVLLVEIKKAVLRTMNYYGFKLLTPCGKVGTLWWFCSTSPFKEV